MTADSDKAKAFERGVRTFSLLFTRWMDSNKWTHPKMVALARAANGGLGWLHSSQISGLRHGTLTNPGPRTFAAIAALNSAIWSYEQTKALIKGTTSSLDYEEASAIADEEGKPPSAGWWLNVFLGDQIPDGVDLKGDWYTEKQAEGVSKAWATLTRKLIAEAGNDLITDLDRILATSYPAGDHDRKAKVKEVLFNQSTWNPEELRAEMPAISNLVKELGGPEDDTKMKELLKSM